MFKVNIHVYTLIIIISMNKQGNRVYSQRENYTEPLVWLPENSIAIFHDKIIQYSKLREKSLSQNNITLATLNDLQQADKVISFYKDDIAFKVNEQQRKITIVKIKNQNIQLEFRLDKTTQLVTVQDTLRRKLCEIGFEQKYRIIKELGKGATAKVYLIERFIDRKLFAAKIMPLKAENKDYETFINESKILRSLKSPYIVRIESLYISKKELISVLEYLEGGTLLEELKADVLKQNHQKLKAIKDITLGLQHLRQKRIVHRDLKLQNIMVRNNKDKTKDYVITDFGLACWIGEKDLLYEKCGTPGYIAPQILRANKTKVIVSHVSDVFSFGIIAHFILTLRAVFPYNGDPKELLLLNKKAVFSLQTKYHQSLLSSQLRILQKTLSIDPQKRTNSRQLLDLWIKDFQREVQQIQNKKLGSKKQERKKKIQQVQPNSSARKNIMKMNNSIEAIEKRAPSVDKNSFHQKRYKTEQNSKHQEVQKKENSVGKMFNKVWNKITGSKSEVMKKKEQKNDRKKEMKSYVF